MTEVSREGSYVGWRVSTGYNQQTVLSRQDGVTAHGVEGISVHGCSLDTCRRDVLPMFGCTSHTTTPCTRTRRTSRSPSCPACLARHTDTRHQGIELMSKTLCQRPGSWCILLSNTNGRHMGRLCQRQTSRPC